MPTYRNDTETRITFPDKHYISWQPGEASIVVPKSRTKKR